MYKRYVDDSNQVAKTPPIGTKYDKNLKKLVVDEQEIRLGEKRLCQAGQDTKRYCK